MRKYFTILTVLAVVVAMAGTTLAATTYRPTKLNEMYVRPGGLPTDGAPVNMPGVSGNNGGINNDGLQGPSRSQGQATMNTFNLAPLNSSAGPLSLGGDTNLVPRGSALVAPSGGAVYTPKQRADREIKSLIRKLQ